MSRSWRGSASPEEHPPACAPWKLRESATIAGFGMDAAKTPLVQSPKPAVPVALAGINRRRSESYKQSEGGNTP